MIIVVGTSHTIQTTDPEFQSFLEGLCRKHGVRAIAEEMSEEALAERDRVDSVPMSCAKARQLPHRLCDPDSKLRATLGILQENDIRLEGLLSGTPLSETDLSARVKDSYTKRERYWLDQIREINVWPVLFVCGADHVASFSDLLRQQCIPVEIASADWRSNAVAQSLVPPNNGLQATCRKRRAPEAER